MLKDDKAFVEAYKVLGKTQMSIETILAKAQSIAKSFFNEKMNAFELFYFEYDEFIKDIE